MNCCGGCQQGIGCDGLGSLPVAQVAALDSYAVAGSVIEWGGHILLNGSDTSAGWDDSMEADIKNALWNHGGFSMVDAGSAGGFFNRYISVRVTTRVDFAQLGNVLTTIEGAIYAAGFRPDTQNFWVASVPQNAANRPGVAQPNAGAGQPSAPSSGGGWSLPSLPNIFGGSTSPGSSSNPIDAFANWLGVGQTEAAVIGAGLALVGILVIKKAL